MKRIALLMISLLLCFAAGAAAENTQPAPDETYECGDYAYILLEDGSAQITKYRSASWEIQIPGELDGHPVSSIGDWAFAFSDNPAYIMIPEGITSIGDYAFGVCDSLASITLPDSVISIGVNPFIGCGKLQSITVSPDHPTLAVIDNVLFDKTEKKLICYPGGLDAANYEIPQEITAVGDSAFSSCKSLTSITIPDSVTSIGDSAFSWCDSLILTVGRDSYAKQYAVENGIQYTYPDANNWLYE